MQQNQYNQDLIQKQVNRPWSIGAAVLLQGLAALLQNSLPLVVGAAAESLSLDYEDLGFLVSAYMIGSTGMTVTLIFWIRRVNWRVASLLSALSLSAGFVLAANTIQYELLRAAFFVAGVGGGGLLGTTTACLVDTRHPARNFGLAALGRIVIPGVVVAVLPIAVIPRWGFAGVSLTLGGLVFMAIPIVMLMPARGKKVEGSLAEVLIRGWRPILALVGIIIFYAGVVGLWTFIERIGDAAGLAPEYVGFIVLMSLVSGGVGALVPIVFPERFGRLLPITISAILLLIAIITLTIHVNAVSYGVASLAVTFGWTVSIIYQQGFVAGSDQTRRIAVAMPAVLSIGYVLGPASAGLLIADGNFMPLYAMVVSTIIISWSIFAVVARSSPRELRDEAS